MDRWPAPRRREFPWLQFSYYALKTFAWLCFLGSLISAILAAKLQQDNYALLEGQVSDLEKWAGAAASQVQLPTPSPVQPLLLVFYGAIAFAALMAYAELIIVALDIRDDTRRNREWIDKASSAK
jgi:hypothetical protein